MASSSLTRRARISGSTWKKEKAILIQMGLLSYVERKEIHEDGIKRIKYYSLTEKGKEVAAHDGKIAKQLGQDSLLEISGRLDMINELERRSSLGFHSHGRKSYLDSEIIRCREQFTS